MQYFQTWQDFMRMPANKTLKESKGIHACKQKYIQEQNKMQWYDPMIIQENGNAGISLTAAAGGAGGGGTSFITGFTKEVSTFAFPATLGTAVSSDGATASLQIGITHHAMQDNNSIDYSQAAFDSRKKLLLVVVSGSLMANFGASGVSTSGYDIVVTASLDTVLAKAGGIGGANNGAWTGSILNELGRAVGAQTATAVVAGFTNTIAPSTLITAVTGSAPYRTLIITNKTKGGVTNASVEVKPLAAGTGSISITTNGIDTFLEEPGGQVFNGQEEPYTQMPWVFNISNI